MKQINIPIFFVVLIFLTLPVLAQVKDKDLYKFRTLAEIFSINKENTDDILRKSKLEDKGGFIGIDSFPSRVRINFAGKSRPISDLRKDFMKTWAKLQQQDEKKLSLYENEFLFKECDSEYWIPVSKNIEKSLTKNYKPGEMVTVFALHVGGQKEPNKNYLEWLFLAIAFEK